MGLKVAYRFPTEEHITFSYNNQIATVTYQEYAEILRSIPRDGSPKEYMGARFKLLTEYLSNNSKEENTYKW